MSDMQELIQAVNTFRDERDWRQFHDPKEMAIAISLEAAEILELFRYKSKEASIAFAKEHTEDIADELADVMYNVMIMAHDLDIDLKQAILNKLEKTAKKYPIKTSKGSAKKYTEL